MSKTKPKKIVVQNPEPHHETLALDILMRWTDFFRIETKNEVREFLFRVAFLMDLDTIGTKTGNENFLAMYAFRGAQYHFTTGILAKYIGYRSEAVDKNSLPREQFLKSTFINGFNAMMKAGQYGVEISVPKNLIRDEGDKKVVSSRVETPENIAGAEKAADKLMSTIPADAFGGKNAVFVKSEMAFQPYENHLPHVKLPKPTAEDYKRREEIEKGNHPGRSNEDAWMDIMNSFDWSHELTKKGELYGLKTALGEVLLPPLFENFTMMTKQELKKGDRVVTQLGGKWGVILADGTGNWIIKPEYDFIGYPNNITHVRKGKKWGVLNLEKKEFIVPLECDHIDSEKGFMFMNGIGSYERGGRWGIVTHYGAFTDAIFEEVELIPEEWVKVKYEGEWGFLDEDMEFTLDEDEAWLNMDVD